MECNVAVFRLLSVETDCVCLLPKLRHRDNQSEVPRSPPGRVTEKRLNVVTTFVPSWFIFEP
jgi:hypothetical protein